TICQGAIVTARAESTAAPAASTTGSPLISTSCAPVSLIVLEPSELRAKVRAMIGLLEQRIGRRAHGGRLGNVAREVKAFAGRNEARRTQRREHDKKSGRQRARVIAREHVADDDVVGRRGV